MPRFFFCVAMVAFIDSMLGKVVQTLQAKGMWDNTLVIIHAE